MTIEIEYLIVAGGGSGGRVIGGGGGAGGYLTGTTTRADGTYTVVVGAGGPAVTTDNTRGTNGDDSSFDTIIATGGGGGGAYAGQAGKNGGSGGGGGGNEGSGTQAAGLGTAGQGNDGGIGGSRPSGYYGAGGGGGAGAVGGTYVTSTGGAGGAGLSSSITGTAIVRGGGGGGNGYSGTGGGGGSGGGGKGGDGNAGVGSATANTGGGGGGSGYQNSGAGGSGIVVLRYLTSAVYNASGGTITTDGIYTVHTFTTSGDFIFEGFSPGLYAPTSVQRGQSFVVTLVTENIPDNTTIAYTITGVTSGDLSGDPLSGNLTIVNNTDTITIQTANIPLNRTLTLSANNLSVQVSLVGARKISATYLLAAGGGGGGTDMGGGGGAGGVLASTIDLTDGQYPIVIGGGGLGNKGVGYNSTPAPGASGTNSTFNGLTALGGAGGGSGHWVPNYRGPTPPVGGSGGGGSPGGIASNPGSAGTQGQGTAGGIGLYISNYFAGAGGGAGGNDEVNGVSNTRPGIGGPGLQSSISGTSLYYGGGGGGAGHTGAGAGTGGLGGGGGGARFDTGVAEAAGGSGGVNPGQSGGRAASAAGGAAGENTGSGGGGGSHSAGHGGNGGSGIFIIRYAGAPRATGGTITAVGDDTVHTFTTSGTFDLDIPAYQPGLNVNASSVYNGDSIEFVYVDQTVADNTTMAYTITGVNTSDINGASLSGNFTIVGGIATLTLTATNVVNKTLTLTANGASLNVTMQYAVTIRYLAVAGGGGGGMDMGGGGGAGGLLRSSSLRTSSGSYNIVIGAGGSGAPSAGTGAGTQGTTAHQFTIPATAGQDTVFANIATAVGGGRGGSSYYPYTPGAAGGNGGSGGGASAYSDGSSRSGGTGVEGQGFRGGNGGPSQYYGGGGGGAGGQGVDANARSDGGPGLEDNILGTSYHWAGGGGGSGYSIQGGNGGIGGGGGGAVGTTTGGAGLNAGQAGGGGTTGSQTNKPGGNGGANTGGGGGGGSHYSATNQGGNGGSGIVVVRYSGGQKAVGGTVTTVSSDTVHTFTSSGTLTVFPGEGLTPSTTSAYFGDTFTVYLTANEPDSTTIPYTITGVTSAEINGASLTGNFTVTNGIASLEIVTVAGTQDNKTFSITAYGYTITVNLTYIESFTIPRTSSGWGIDQVFTLVTRNLADSTTVPYTITGVTSEDLNGASLTGNITITGNQGTLTVDSDPLLLTSKTLTVTIPGSIALSVNLTFVTVPIAEFSKISSIDGISVTTMITSDLEESEISAQDWVESFEEQKQLNSNIDGISVIPSLSGDLKEQVTVAIAIGNMPRIEDPKEVRMAGISASPTYVYTDGAPIAAPDPTLTLTVEQWTIT